MPTPNYEIPTINPTDQIDIATDVNAALNKIDTALKNVADTAGESISDVTETVGTKAPINHASTAKTYGVSTNAMYGHAKVVNSIANTDDGSVALSPNAVRPVLSYKGLEMIAFGDSFMDPDVPNSDQGYLPNKISEALGTTLHNYAVAGAGFARTGNLVSSQITKATSELNATQKANTGFVLIYAGYNDIANEVDQTEVNNGMVSACETCRGVFPNATVMLVPYNWGLGDLTVYTENKICTSLWSVKRSLAATNVIIADNARFWILGNNTSFKNAVHPSQSGYDAICAHILNLLNGGSDDTRIGNTLFAENVVGNFHNGFMTVEGYFKPPQNISAGGVYNFTNRKWNLLSPTHDLCTPIIDYANKEVCGILVIRTGQSTTGYASILASKNMVTTSNYWIVPVTYHSLGANPSDMDFS